MHSLSLVIVSRTITNPDKEKVTTQLLASGLAAKFSDLYGSASELRGDIDLVDGMFGFAFRAKHSKKLSGLQEVENEAKVHMYYLPKVPKPIY